MEKEGRYRSGHKGCQHTRLLITAALALVVCVVPAQAEPSCIYTEKNGALKQVKSMRDVPRSFRAGAVCQDLTGKQIAAPQDVKLEGGARTAELLTELGRLNVRWPRKIEECFGKSPARAVSEAAAAANKAIKNARFSPEVRQGRRDWSLVFTDKATALAQFPAELSLGRHPGFMLPPSQIYIIADYVNPDCAAGLLADETLAQVLLHEIGHVIEFLLLGSEQLPNDPRRSEGFATWFEQYSADFMQGMPKGKVTKFYTALAKDGFVGRAAPFTGSSQDYAVAALQFRAIVNRKGISGLMQLYKVMRESRISFSAALERELRWNQVTLEREMQELLEP